MWGRPARGRRKIHISTCNLNNFKHVCQYYSEHISDPATVFRGYKEFRVRSSSIWITLSTSSMFLKLYQRCICSLAPVLAGAKSLLLLCPILYTLLYICIPGYLLHALQALFHKPNISNVWCETGIALKRASHSTNLSTSLMLWNRIKGVGVGHAFAQHLSLVCRLYIYIERST